MSHIQLSKIPTRAPEGLSKKATLVKNQQMITEIQAYQQKMYAVGNKSLLIILQGLDASGKDGVVKYIFSGMNPMGTRATSFRVPTKEEASHDFLWRIHRRCPEQGMVQVFNRSHYEDILVPTVEKIFPEKVIEKRYDQINDFEKLLESNGTVILKFYLHISKEKQKEKLNERLTDPTKYRKHKIGDWDTRDEYKDYMEVYEDIFKKCNEPERHIIPADQNWYKIHLIAKVILKAFEDMDLKRPKLSADQETMILKAKAELAENKERKRIAKEEQKRKELELKKEFKKELKEKVEKVEQEMSKKDNNKKSHNNVQKREHKKKRFTSPALITMNLTKKTPVKKTAPAKKAPVKAVAKKAVAKKVAPKAKAVVKKTVKAPAKKAPVKAVAKKVVAKKAAPKAKVVAKKTVKAPAKKVVAKKAPVKAVAKKTAPKKK